MKSRVKITSPTKKRKVSPSKRKTNTVSSPLKKQQACKTAESKGFQRFHLVLDLDATFVSTFSYCDEDEEDSNLDGRLAYKNIQKIIQKLSKTDPEKAKELEKRVHIFSLNNGDRAFKMWTILRPGTFEFIEFASIYFDRISIWSAGKEDYVNQIVALLFPAYMPRPEIILSWANCEKTYVEKNKKGKTVMLKTTEEKDDDVHSFSKPLRFMANYLDVEGSVLSKTLILDDRDDIAESNENNLIHIPPYKPKFFLESGKASCAKDCDKALKELTEWLMKPDVINSPDVRKLDKNCIFSSSSAVSSQKIPLSPSPSHKTPSSPKRKPITLKITDLPAVIKKTKKLPPVIISTK